MGVAALSLGAPSVGLVSMCNGAVWSCPNYYTYAAPLNSGAFRVTVSQYSGSGATDLYVGDWTTPTPGPPPLTSNWSSVSYAPLQIVDVPAAAVSCTPANLPNSTVSSGVCVFYFSVAPFAPGTLLYSIVVTNTSAAAAPPGARAGSAGRRCGGTP